MSVFRRSSKPVATMRTAILTVVVGMGFAMPHTARGFVAGGGKDVTKGNDCLIGYHGIADADVTFDGTKQLVACTDCDPTCDLDGTGVADGACTFGIGVCINQSGVDGCSPPVELTRASASAKIAKR